MSEKERISALIDEDDHMAITRQLGFYDSLSKWVRDAVRLRRAIEVGEEEMIRSGVARPEVREGTVEITVDGRTITIDPNPDTEVETEAESETESEINDGDTADTDETDTNPDRQPSRRDDHSHDAREENQDHTRDPNRNSTGPIVGEVGSRVGSRVDGPCATTIRPGR
jgi:hypothetical protein